MSVKYIVVWYPGLMVTAKFSSVFELLQGLIISQYTSSQLRELSEAPEYGELSNDTKDSLFKKSCGTFKFAWIINSVFSLEFCCFYRK